MTETKKSKTRVGNRLDWLVGFRQWCAKERVGRAEAGTSQDMCPTNGDALFFNVLMIVAWVPLAIVLFFFN